MMSMTLEVQRIMKECSPGKYSAIVKKIERLRDLERRGILTKPQPQTFETSKKSSFCTRNQHINFYLTSSEQNIFVPK